jgi:hypothetical protein
MYQPSRAPTPNTNTTPDSDTTLLEIDGELARQNVELTEALEWLRQQGDAALPVDGELLEQIAELDRLVTQSNTPSSPSVPDHSTRC